MGGVEELGMDDIANFGMVENLKLGMIEDQELVGVVDKFFGFEVTEAFVTVSAEAAGVGMGQTFRAADGIANRIKAGVGGVETMANSKGPDRCICDFQDPADLSEGFAFLQHFLDLLATGLLGGIRTDPETPGFRYFLGNGSFFDLEHLGQLRQGV